MHLPDDLRDKLKKPLGILLKDSDATRHSILANLPQGSFVISVGDATTEKLIKFGIIPSLQIVDGVEKRIKRMMPNTSVKTTLYCKNPPTQITTESLDMIKKGFKSTTPVLIVVTGEEDLLVLPVVVFAPENSVVLYGQPNEGLVIVPINTDIRNKAQSIMDLMN